MERLGLSLFVLALAVVFSACGTSNSAAFMNAVESEYIEETNRANVQEDQNLESSDFTNGASGQKINFVTDCIKIYCDTDEFSVPIVINDILIIDEISSTINVLEWVRVELENEIAATPAYYIDFCNGTVLSMLYDTGYGNVGTAFFRDSDENGMITFGVENSDGPYLYNDGLYDAIKKIVAEYQ